jgi:hypothetical protein
MNTEVTYLYRDAGNYKFRLSFVVTGKFDPAEIAQHLIDGEFFIPAAIGLPRLIPEVRNDDDHEWHCFEDVQPTPASDVACTAEELKDRIRRADEKGWYFG